MSTNTLHRFATGVAQNVRPKLHRDRKHHSESQDYPETAPPYPVEPNSLTVSLSEHKSDLNMGFQVPPARPPRPNPSLLPPPLPDTIEQSPSLPVGQMGMPQSTYVNTNVTTRSQTVPYPETGTGPYKWGDSNTYVATFSAPKMGFYPGPCFPESKNSGIYPATEADTLRNVDALQDWYTEPCSNTKSTAYNSRGALTNTNSYRNTPSNSNMHSGTCVGSNTNIHKDNYPEMSNGTCAEMLVDSCPAMDKGICVDNDTQREQDRFGGVQGKVFSSPMTGIMQFLSVKMSHIVGGKQLDQKGLGSFKCYMWSIGDTNKYFGDLWYHWNTEYSVARQIFGGSVESRAVQEGIRLQRSALYRNSNVRGMGCRDVTVKTGAEFLRLLNYGQSQGHICYYTYVIMHSTWCFSRTGKDMMKDITSKHAMHADCSEKVRYAGEFVIVPNSHGDRRLVIDNNSGTYAPTPDGLPYVVNMLKALFVGLDVEGLDRISNQHKAIREWVASHNSQLGSTIFETTS